jgi:transcriptional regulator with GAF, ATPase, and Fis domain
MQKSERRILELQNILEATRLLNASKDIDFILKELLNATLKLISRADIGIIFLYDRDSGMLKSKCSFGFNEMSIALKPGESITGITFVRKETLHLKSNQEMMDLMAFMEPENRKMLDEKIIKPMKDLQSSISCPLIHDDECIGVFVLDNYSGKDPLTEDDVYLAELISVQATIAIKNAAIYENEIRNQRSLKIYSEMLEIEKNRYQYSTYLHNRFTEMILKKSTIDDIVREVSMLLQSDVFVIDSFYSVISYWGDFSVSRDALTFQKSNLLDHMDVQS